MLCFEYASQGDLWGYLGSQRAKFKKNKCEIDYLDVANKVIQILKGIQTIHSQNVIHRDIKSQNVLILEDNTLVLGDFGLARKIREVLQFPLTRDVQSLWYRAPELLLGNKWYSYPLDYWSAGVIAFELTYLCPMFCASSELDLLMKIFQLKGTPTDWSSSLKNHDEYGVLTDKSTNFAKLFPKFKPQVLPLKNRNGDPVPDGKEIFISNFICGLFRVEDCDQWSHQN